MSVKRQKTLNKINDAMGGVLFIDEAYSLMQNTDSGTAGYGDEAVAVLLKQMEDKEGSSALSLQATKQKWTSLSAQIRDFRQEYSSRLIFLTMTERSFRK